MEELNELEELDREMEKDKKEIKQNYFLKNFNLIVIGAVIFLILIIGGFVASKIYKKSKNQNSYNPTNIQIESNESNISFTPINLNLQNDLNNTNNTNTKIDNNNSIESNNFTENNKSIDSFSSNSNLKENEKNMTIPYENNNKKEQPNNKIIQENKNEKVKVDFATKEKPENINKKIERKKNFQKKIKNKNSFKDFNKTIQSSKIENILISKNIISIEYYIIDNVYTIKLLLLNDKGEKENLTLNLNEKFYKDIYIKEIKENIAYLSNEEKIQIKK